MKFSIVTISFNQAQFLEQAIRSVLSQEGVDFEYIVVDPGSTDGSREIIEKYRSRLAAVIYERDSGPADGLNRGFARAGGDWFGYLNSDDYYLPGGLAAAARAIARHPRAGAVVGNGVLVDEAGGRLRASLSQRHSLARAAYGAAFALQQATFYRAEAFRAVGGFNLANRTCWDGEILVDLALAGHAVARFGADVGAFRLHGASITGSGRMAALYAQNSARLFRKIKGRAPGPLEEAVLMPLSRKLWHLADPWRSLRLLKDRSERRRSRR
ncbi:glycosyltransferase family 2 protein [Azorhizobium doebereinerae]|uniref:glycosyltransferase family 2 protein n=1 Tax=Azorhizobium doebereinerae TaxID=281091 RepID=UPI000411D09D|nr:glycosyltransferase family 2 protein [Azorhizobium doebereinerae]